MADEMAEEMAEETAEETADERAKETAEVAGMALRILTFNVRYAATELEPNERPWPERRGHIASLLQHESRYLDGSGGGAACIICLQEALQHQLDDILADLNGSGAELAGSGPIWQYAGVGRDDGRQAGEYCAIVYPARLFRLLHSETVWLSETPARPSRGWDAALPRIMTAAVLERQGTGTRILACNAHLDHAGPVSRANSVPVMLRAIDRIAARWSEPGTGTPPVFLAGDFNSKPGGEAYGRMRASGVMADLMHAVPPRQRFGDVDTFTGFGPASRDEGGDGGDGEDDDERGRIDFLWLGTGEAGGCLAWTALGYAALANVGDDGIYASDHRCVVGDVRL